MATQLFGALAGLGMTGEQLAQGAEIARKRRVETEKFDIEKRKAEIDLKASQEGITMLPGVFKAPDGSYFTRGIDSFGKVKTFPIGGAPVVTTRPSDFMVRLSALSEKLGRDPTIDEIMQEEAELAGGKSAATKPQKLVGTPPYGIMRGNQVVLPANMTPAERADFDAGIKSYQTNAKMVLDRMVQAREAYWKARPIQVYKSDGSLGFATGAQIAARPEQYAPPGPAMQTRNRLGIFNELDKTTELVDKAIAKMGDEEFNPEARAQLAFVLRSGDPKTAFNTFTTSAVATTLDPSQVDFVTAIVDLAESAMALRSVQGIGQGSDMVREAIVAMLPGAGTPSKAYAQRQMDLFKVEVNALRWAIPGIPGIAAGGGAPQTGKPVVQRNAKTGAYRYSLDGGQTWQPGQPPSR